jgi:hypothetical protein
MYQTIPPDLGSLPVFNLLETRTYNEFPPEPVGWLWEPYLARGKLAVLDGDPGIGKTLLALDLAARLSRGGPLPDGKTLDRPHTTLLLTADDPAADTIRPRLEAAGADLDRVFAVVPRKFLSFRLPENLDALEAIVRERRADLVVLDPLAFFVPDALTGGYLSTRTALIQIACSARNLGYAVLLVRHLTKARAARAVCHGLGSVGVAGTVSSGLLLARHPDDPDLRVLTQTKNKCGPPAPSLGFRIAPDDRGRAAARWAGPVDLTADELCAAPPVPPGRRPRERAVEWLRAELANGPRRAAELIAAAATAGIPLRTLDRAKKEYGVTSEQVGLPGTTEWVWSKPSALDRAASDRDTRGRADGRTGRRGGDDRTVSRESECQTATPQEWRSGILEDV